MTVDASSLPQPTAAPSGQSRPWSAWVLDGVDRYRKWLLAMLVAFYVAGFNGQWRMEPDSALYLAIARNLAVGEGYTYHGRPNAIAYPGLPYVMAGIFKLMPAYHRKPENLVPENLLMLGCALGVLGLTYRLIRLNAGRPTAVLVTCGLGITRTFYRYAFELMTDMPFLLGVMLILTGFEGLMVAERDANRRRKIAWVDGGMIICGIIIAVVMRPAWLVLIPVLGLAILVAAIQGKISRRHAAVALALAAVAAVIFFATDPRRAAGKIRLDRYEDQFFNQFSAERRVDLAGNILENARVMIEETAASAPFGLKFMTLPEPGQPWRWYTWPGVTGNVIAGSLILIGGIALLRRRGLWGMWIVATIVMMLLVLPHERYFLQALPLLIYGWWRVLVWVNRKLPGKLGNGVFAVLLLLGTTLNAGLCAHLVIEQREVPFFAHYKDGECAPFLRVAHVMRQILPQDVVVLAPQKTGRILSYLSRRTVSEENDLALDVNWPAAGRQVYVLNLGDDPDFADWLKKLGIEETAAVPGGPAELRIVTRRSGG